MDHQYSGWSMIPNIPNHVNSPSATSNQENLFLQQQQQFHLQQQQQQQQFQFQQQQQQQQQNLYQQQQQLQQQRMQFQQSPLQNQMQITQPQPQPQPQPQQTLASHFQLQHLVDKLADTIENGTRDPHSELLITEISSQYEKCQNLLNSIATATGSKNMTVEGQKSKLEESEQLLNQRRELIAKYRNSVEELIKPNP